MALLPPTEVRMAECGICYETYKEAASGQVPKLLWCGHSLCLACLRQLVGQSSAFSFVVCPFCRMVTLVPEGGPQGLRNNELLLQQMASIQGAMKMDDQEELGNAQDSARASSWAPGDSAPALDFNYQPHSPIFTVSSFVPAYATAHRPGMGIWGRFRLQEVRSAVLVELPHRASSRDSETPTSVENLRLCFAVTIILLIVSVFFTLVFLK